jgi:hypothetical protein
MPQCETLEQQLTDPAAAVLGRNAHTLDEGALRTTSAEAGYNGQLKTADDCRSLHRDHHAVARLSQHFLEGSLVSGIDGVRHDFT